MKIHLESVYGDLLQFFQEVAEIFTSSTGSNALLGGFSPLNRAELVLTRTRIKINSCYCRQLIMDTN